MPRSTHRYTGPALLTTRVGAADESFVRRLYGLVPGSPPPPTVPRSWSSMRMCH